MRALVHTVVGAFAIAACTNDFGVFEQRPEGGSPPTNPDGGTGTPDAASSSDGGGGANDGGGGRDSGGGDGGCTVSQACLGAAGQCRSTCRTQRNTCENGCPGGGPNRQQCMDGCRTQEGTCKNTCESTCNTCTTQAGCPAPSACRSASQ